MTQQTTQPGAIRTGTTDGAMLREGENPGSGARVLMVDNYDSFTYNLVQLLRALGAAVSVFRNDEITVQQARAHAPTHVVISPGPGGPREAGVSMAMIEGMAGHAVVLGVCLGHQAMAEVFGGRVAHAKCLMHGKSSMITHDGRGVFAGAPSPLQVGRYHSLALIAPDEAGVPRDLIVTARSDDGEVMGLRHRTLAIEGVQFHPESVLTPMGPSLIANFLRRRETTLGPAERKP